MLWIQDIGTRKELRIGSFTKWASILKTKSPYFYIEMRNWNINPKLLCRQHLLGEHFEIHKAVGNLRHSGKWTISLTNKGFLEPQNFLKRHNQLIKEMIKRGFKHNSPLEIKELKLPMGKVDIKKSIKDLKNRCKECKKRIENLNLEE